MMVGEVINQGPFTPSTPLGLIIQLLFLLLFLIFMIFGQRIQMYMLLKQVESSLDQLKALRDEGKRMAIDALKEFGNPNTDPVARVDQFLEHIAIGPESMDPAGVVYKLEHILDVRNERCLDEVRLIAPKADDVQLHNLENLLEAALALNVIYKVIRHYYLLGKKTFSYYIILQLQMLLPLVIREAKAYAGALTAFFHGQPIGDGVGPLVAAKLMRGKEIKRIAKDIVAAETEIEGRKAYVVKAEGPGARVGKPGDAVKRIIEEHEGKIAAVIFVDAALKLEGEKLGEIADGVGVAMGGPGVEKFKVEGEATKYGVPVYAVIVKEDIGDAVSPMHKDLYVAADNAIERIKSIIRERTKEGDTIIVVGVGNTVGIGQ